MADLMSIDEMRDYLESAQAYLASDHAPAYGVALYKMGILLSRMLDQMEEQEHQITMLSDRIEGR